MKSLLVLPAVALAMIASSASAVTFATFNATTDGNVSYTGTGNGAGVIGSVDAPVTFRFLDAFAGFTDFAATFNLAVTTTTGSTVGPFAIVPVSAGTFSFVAPTAVTYNGQTGTNLLSASFTGGAVFGTLGGSTATYGTSTPPNVVTFSSDFIDFSTSSANDLALAIDAISPLLSAGGTGVTNFTGTVVGTFGSDVLGGGGNPQGTVPEPASWALMIVGFGLVGFAARRRRSGMPVVTA